MYKICAYIRHDSTSYVMSEGGTYYHVGTVSPPPCAFWYGPRLRIASFADIEEFNVWVSGWDKKLASFTFVPRTALDISFESCVKYYEVGERSFFDED